MTMETRTVDDPVLEGDPFRRDFGLLSQEQKDDMRAIKFAYENVWIGLTAIKNAYGLSRDLQIACTELQTSCMWAVRAVTDMTVVRKSNDVPEKAPEPVHN